MKFLPIFMNIKDQPCLVVGGGRVASRKVFMLERAIGAELVFFTLAYLPRYAPVLNPDEQVWNHAKRALGQKFIETKDEMKRMVIYKCVELNKKT